jgi:hypothetical protein
MNDLWAKKAWKGAQLQKDYSKKGEKTPVCCPMIDLSWQ